MILAIIPFANMISSIKKSIKKLLIKQPKVKSKKELIETYNALGSVPWSEGYLEYKWHLIEGSINNKDILKEFELEQLTNEYGIGVDERVIEYPWLMSHIHSGKGKFLDAGSTFNFQEILRHPIMQEKDIYIYTYYPEENNYIKSRISYIYGDLRELPFKDNYFDQIVCHSTLEHIDMDNSMYGYELAPQQDSHSQSYGYLKVIRELERVLKPGGRILLTFPYGKFENHGFFQQFDKEMVLRLENSISSTCSIKKSFAKYEASGWRFATQAESDDSVSCNPHTGKGKENDNAAHSRAICFIEILKNSQSQF